MLQYWIAKTPGRANCLASGLSHTSILCCWPPPPHRLLLHFSTTHSTSFLLIFSPNAGESYRYWHIVASSQYQKLYERKVPWATHTKKSRWDKFRHTHALTSNVHTHTQCQCRNPSDVNQLKFCFLFFLLFGYIYFFSFIFICMIRKVILYDDWLSVKRWPSKASGIVPLSMTVRDSFRINTFFLKTDNWPTWTTSVREKKEKKKDGCKTQIKQRNGSIVKGPTASSSFW